MIFGDRQIWKIIIVFIFKTVFTERVVPVRTEKNDLGAWKTHVIDETGRKRVSGVVAAENLL